MNFLECTWVLVDFIKPKKIFLQINFENKVPCTTIDIFHFRVLFTSKIWSCQKSLVHQRDFQHNMSQEKSLGPPQFEWIYSSQLKFSNSDPRLVHVSKIDANYAFRSEEKLTTFEFLCKFLQKEKDENIPNFLVYLIVEMAIPGKINILECFIVVRSFFCIFVMVFFFF